MKKTVFLFLSLLLSPNFLSGSPDSQHLKYGVIKTLYEIFSTEDPVYSSDFFQNLSSEIKLELNKSPNLLLSLLDSLDNERRNNTPIWKNIVSKSSPEIDSQSAHQLIKYWIQESRNILKGEKNYLLDRSMRKAARKAQIPFFQSRIYLLRTLQSTLANTAEKTSKSQVGLVVSGQSKLFEISLDPLFIFFNTTEESFVREKVRDLQRFIVPALVSLLPESEYILWAVRKRESNVLIEPDYNLIVTIENLRFSGSNADLKPCIDLDIKLISAKTNTPKLDQPFNICSSNGTLITGSLDEFWNEISNKIRSLIEERISH